MLFRNDGRSKDHILQNQFTAYLTIAIARRKSILLAERIKLRGNELPMEFNGYYAAPDPQPETVEQMDFKSELLEQALWSLNERDRYIVFSHAITGRDFKELAKELGLSYKGTAAAYYRAMKTIKHTMGDDNT